MSKRRIGLVTLLVLLGLVVLAPTAAVMYLASTEAGLRFIAARIQRIGRVQVEARGIEGSLTGGFRVERLVIDNPWVHMEFTHVAARASLLPLLWQNIELPEAVAETALIQVRRPPPRPRGTPGRMRFMPGTLRVDADRVALAQGTLQLADGRRYDATAIEAAAVVRNREIRVLHGGMELPNLRVQANGRLRAGRPLALNGTTRLNIHAEGQPDWIIHGEFDGDLEEMPLKATVTAPFRAGFEGRAVDLTSGWRWRGTAAVEDFDIRAWGGGAALGLIRGTLTLGGDASGYTAQGQLEPLGLAAGRFDVDARGAYGDRRVTLRRVQLAHRGSGARADLAGSVLVQSEGPLLQLDGTWTGFRWPLTGDEVAATSPAGRFSLQGVREYALRASGELAPAGLPPMPVTLQGVLAPDRLVVSEGSAEVYGGHAALSGEARWSPDETWTLRGTARDVDMGRIREDLPGTLALDFNASGRGFGATGELDVDVARAEGRLRGRPASGSGRFERRGAPQARSWNFAGVDLRVGGSRVDLDGTLGATRDLRFDVASDDLSLLSPRLRGRVTARGRLAGDAAAPVLRVRIQGRDFERDADSLQALDADLDVQLSGDGPTRGTLHATRLLFAGRRVDDIKLDLSGNASASIIGLNLQAPPVAVAVRARGAFMEGRWRGLIDSFDITDGDALALRLTEFAPLTVGEQAVTLGRACLEGGDARLCLQGSHAEGQWLAATDARNLPLRAVTAGLSRDTSYEGRIGIELEARGGRGMASTGHVAARLEGALLRHRLPNGREERIALGTGTVDGDLRAEDFGFRVGLDAGDSGLLKGQLDGRRTAGPWSEWPVQGSAELATDAFGLLDLFAGQVDRAAGRLAAHLDIGGTLGTPSLLGELQVRNGELDFLQVNLAVRELSFDARLSDKSLDLKGSLRAGEGTANVEGRISWSDDSPHGRLALKGERLRLVNVPEAQLLASPDLVFQIDGRRIQVTGEVDVPEAHLDPADLTNAVRPSGDERLTSAAPRDPQQQFQVTSNITLRLGDEVTINTNGLSGRLTGTIEARSDANEVSRATGELNVAEGRYIAFGRNLDIERGRLLFNNGLLADPGIDLRAQKVFPDVTAGVNVRGTLRAPRMTFFSEPAIPQSQIVSLILAGGSLESVQNSDRRGAARNDLLAQGGAIFAQQFGNRVGIEDIGVESDRSNETSLVLGKYLSPAVYVSYGISLAEAINTVKLRYTIDDHWTVKIESGRERSADVVFTIRK